MRARSCGGLQHAFFPAPTQPALRLHSTRPATSAAWTGRAKGTIACPDELLSPDWSEEVVSLPSVYRLYTGEPTKSQRVVGNLVM